MYTGIITNLTNISNSFHLFYLLPFSLLIVSLLMVSFLKTLLSIEHSLYWFSFPWKIFYIISFVFALTALTILVYLLLVFYLLIKFLLFCSYYTFICFYIAFYVSYLMLFYHYNIFRILICYILAYQCTLIFISHTSRLNDSVAY